MVPSPPSPGGPKNKRQHRNGLTWRVADIPFYLGHVPFWCSLGVGILAVLILYNHTIIDARKLVLIMKAPIVYAP